MSPVAAAKPEHLGGNTCPLCWTWFDTKTGLSNHVRGHLRRIGRSSTSKSPLCVLHELLEDRRERRNVHRVRFPSRPLVSQRFILRSFAPQQEAEATLERKKLQVEAQIRTKATSSTLVELLKMRRRLELMAGSRRFCAPTNECKEEEDMRSEQQNWSLG